MKSIKTTKSICPECQKVIDATIYEQEEKVYITKTCPEHGKYTDLYWGSYNQYLRSEKYAHDGVVMTNPRTEEAKGCPFDCGICPNHKSTTMLGIIDVTNRCNLRCPICFAHAGAAGYLYEPTKEQIKEMMQNLRKNNPVKTPALQFSGGEPTVREDLPELIKMAKRLGFPWVAILPKHHRERILPLWSMPYAIPLAVTLTASRLLKDGLMKMAKLTNAFMM